MNKYAQLKRFHHDLQIQVYMYYFMYIGPDTISVEDHFPDTKTFFVNYNKVSNPGSVPKHWLGFSYIRSEDYELDHNFYDTSFLKQSKHTPNNKEKLFREIIVVVEEEWFDAINLTDGATFLTALIKREKTTFNKNK